ncbi:MAG: 2-amino-4-hydroxy-6-hydroxymethyldihydropteridine diphosphokinase [Flavobacteriales bacterium]
MTHLVHIAFGSNMGDRRGYISEALAAITDLSNTELISTSSLYSSKPWGYESEHLFINGVCSVRASKSAIGLLSALQRIEKSIGRTAKTTDGYSDRVIDLDLVSYGRLVLNTPKLTVPHGLAHVRNFVLEPMAEISPEWVHPLYLETAETLLARLNEAPLTKVDAL